MEIGSRSLETRIDRLLFRGKAVALFGARQVGKTMPTRCWVLYRYSIPRPIIPFGSDSDERQGQRYGRNSLSASFLT